LERELELPSGYAPAPDLFTGRVVLVTGAGSGIGRAVAAGLGRHGATVVLLGRTVRKLEAVYDAIVEAGGPEPAIVPMNLAGATPEDHEALTEQLETGVGRLDGVFHNAAVLGPLSGLERYDLATWAEVLQVNLNAPFLLTRAGLPLLRRAPDATILFAGADVGRRGRAYWGAYGVSKAALEGLMETLAAELETNTRIRVNSLDPGPVRTALRAAAFPAEDVNRLVVPEQIVTPYLYLLGPDAREIHGERLTLG
jgi:NAD(P)-dependent dehydrogenase (short-subunit alcohol dehydrogenase family)